MRYTFHQELFRKLMKLPSATPINELGLLVFRSMSQLAVECSKTFERP